MTTHSQDKRNKKHHHKSVVPPKKSKNKAKKKDGTARKASKTKLSAVGSKVSLKNGSSRHNVKKDNSIDGILPSIAPSDTAINYFNEQGSCPTRQTTKMEPTAHSPVTMALPAPPLPPPIQSPTPVQPAAVSPPPVVEPAAPTKWKGQDVSLVYVNKLDASVGRQEYVDVCANTQVSIDKDCQVWKKNLMKNQSDAYPIPDSSLVKINNSPDEYVNLSSVIVPHCRYPILMGQMPKKGCEEEFWKATFQESVVMMYILKGPDDEKCEFFPTSEGAYLYYGTMFVNNRKVEKMDEERTRYTIEVLPNGFSNSILANIYVHTGWEAHGVPVKYANTTRSVVDVMNFVKTSNGTEKLMVVSRNGAGRAGYFLSLGAAFCCLNDQSEPRIAEIVKAIRQQRPNSVDSMKQYASLYLCLLYYIKKKITVPDGMKQKVEDVTKAFESLIREDLSIIY